MHHAEQIRYGGNLEFSNEEFVFRILASFVRKGESSAVDKVRNCRNGRAAFSHS